MKRSKAPGTPLPATVTDIPEVKPGQSVALLQ